MAPQDFVDSPLNRGDIVTAYRRDGIVRLRRFFNPGQVDAIRAELDRYIREDLPSKPADACTPGSASRSPTISAT